MNKKGFTLMELLAIIVILGLIALIAVPVVTDVLKDIADKAYNENIETIKEAAYDWSLINTRLLPNEDGESIVVYLGNLKVVTNIDMDIKNPKSGKVLSNNTSVTITKNGATYDYNVNLVEIDRNEGDLPTLIISGDIVDYVEVNQDNISYTMPTVVARNTNGEEIVTTISHQIIKDDHDVSSIDTSSLGVYKIVYSVTYGGKTGTYEKVVIVRDTTRPELDVGENITCRVGNLPSNLLTGVSVTDNSGESITPTFVSEVKNNIGTYYVTYTATDSSNNSVTKRRMVIVEE